MASPVKLALGGFFRRCALVTKLPFHPDSTPSKPVNKNAAAPADSLKPRPPLKTIPVGNPPVASAGEGIFTGGAMMAPSAEYSSLTCPPTEFTQAIPLGLHAMPNPF